MFIFQTMKEKKGKKACFSLRNLSCFLLLTVVFYFLISCGTYEVEKKYDDESKEFLKVVRYLITAKEHKIFTNLPPSERKEFIEEFWRRRDPHPGTEENEFKEAYLNRIKKANEFFGVGQAGYYSDRGMIYVLFGPPDDIHKSQIFTKRAGSDQEVWLYSRLIDKYPNVRIYFIDRFGTDNFELVKNSAIYSILQEAKLYYINLAQNKRSFPFEINLIRIREEENKADLLIHIKVPYNNIWFTSTEDKMEMTLSLQIKILDAIKNKIWEFEKDYFYSFQEKEVKQFFGQKHLIEIPLTLKKGSYMLKANLITQTGEKGEKVIEFRI